MTDDLVKRGYLTQSLGSALHSGLHGIDTVPELLRRVLESRAWEKRIIVETGEEFEGFPSFEAYVKAPPTKGLGTSIVSIKRIIGEEHQELLDAIDQEVQQPAGNPNFSNHRQNTIGVNHPNSVDIDIQYGITEQGSRDRSEKIRRRLRKDFPELYKRVLNKEMTETAAAVEAGIYPPRRNVNIRDAKSAAKTLRTYASPEFIDELRNLLNS